MEVVSVNTKNTGDPAGSWKADPERLGNCDYVLDESSGKVYSFSGVSKPDSNGRVNFIGLHEETSPIVLNQIKNNIDTGLELTNKGTENIFFLVRFFL